MNFININKMVLGIDPELVEDFDPDQSYKNHVMSAFYFEDDYGIPKCHCTHKYFGKYGEGLNDGILKKAIVTIDNYWDSFNKKERIWNFDQFEMFGEDEDVAVMRSANNKNKLMKLKEQLDEIVPDKYPEYKPHVTLKLPPDHVNPKLLKGLVMRPVHYALVRDDNIIKKWDMV